MAHEGCFTLTCVGSWNVRDGIGVWWLIGSSILQQIGFSCKTAEF